MAGCRLETRHQRADAAMDLVFDFDFDPEVDPGSVRTGVGSDRTGGVGSTGTGVGSDRTGGRIGSLSS